MRPFAHVAGFLDKVHFKEHLTKVPPVEVPGQDLFRSIVEIGHREFSAVALSFPLRTGPLFLETDGGCDGSETSLRRGHTEAAARD